jgi:Cys-tRNA synthase (O-phospho-L-seryl-tRNA:Cys-tRNA synthase)
MFCRAKVTHTVHLYVTQAGLIRLLQDIENFQNQDGVLVTSGARHNSLISVWITSSQYANLISSDLQAKYGTN